MPGVASEPVVKDSRNLYAFGATSFFNDTASEMAYWVLPAFLASIGADPEKLGFIEGIAESVASFAKLFSGYLADRLARRKPIVVSGYVVANAEKTKVGAAFGLLQAMDSAGAIAGPLLALGILAHYSMRGVFWAAVVPGGLSILVATFGIRERQHRPRTGSRELGTLSWHAHLPA